MCVSAVERGQGGRSKAVECLCITCSSRIDMFKNSTQRSFTERESEQHVREGGEKIIINMLNSLGN